MASLNIASLVSHIDELRIWIEDQNLDLLAINETRLDVMFNKREAVFYQSIKGRGRSPRPFVL